MSRRNKMKVTPLNEAARLRRCVLETGEGLYLKSNAFVVRRGIMGMLTRRDNDVCEPIAAGRSIRMKESFKLVFACEGTDKLAILKAIEEPALTLYPVFEVSPLSRMPVIAFVPFGISPAAMVAAV